MFVIAGRICSVVGNTRWERNSKDLLFHYLCEGDRNEKNNKLVYTKLWPLQKVQLSQ